MLIRRPVEMRPIPGFEGRYSITRDGRVWSHGKSRTWNKPRWMKTYKDHRGRGYLCIVLRHTKHFMVHKLVMMAWGPPKPSPEHQCNHRNGITTDNHISNLEWVLPFENTHHAMDNGLRTKRFSEADVIEMRWRYADGDGERIYELAREFGVPHDTIGRIVRRQRWRHI